MLTFTRRPHYDGDPSPSTSGLLGCPRPPRLRWMNFKMCPHCLANERPGMLKTLNEWWPIISRSDGANFHLVLGDRPIFYPAGRAVGKAAMMSAGFWYVHEANGGSPE